MVVSADKQFLHDWVIRMLVEKYSKLYSEININPGDEKTHDFNGFYPDAVFVNYGQVTQIVEVETKDTINEDRVEYWKEVADLGAKLVILVPKECQKKAMDLCWNNGLAAKVKIGTFDVAINV